MYSIKELFKIGNGPSSSHTIGPKEAAKEFLKRFPDVQNVQVRLFGSLASTGKGHLTDEIIINTFAPTPCEVVFDELTPCDHPNTMEFFGFVDDVQVCHMRAQSIGGGAIHIIGDKERINTNIYPHTKLSAIIQFCKDYKMRLYEYVDSVEALDDYLEKIYLAMRSAIDRGLNTTGVLPGPLQIRRKAKYLFFQKSKNEDNSEQLRRRTVSYAYATCEENASGGEIVTAPTCGASGVLPAVVRYAEDLGKFSHEEIINALKTAGLIGNLVKFNASISGAEAGCQAEVGTACAMAAAFLTELTSGDPDAIDSAAEIALEHHLGLTCDPVDGYVQIPCIERNAVAALRALDAARLSSYLNNADSKISFDLVVETMLETGRDMSPIYRETSKGGLAKKFMK